MKPYILYTRLLYCVVANFKIADTKNVNWKIEFYLVGFHLRSNSAGVVLSTDKVDDLEICVSDISAVNNRWVRCDQNKSSQLKLDMLRLDEINRGNRRTS